MSSLNYWCHTCSATITPQGPNIICPLCGGDFIEQIEEEDRPENFVVFGGTQQSPQTSATTNNSFSVQQIFNQFQQSLQQSLPRSPSRTRTAQSQASQQQQQPQPQQQQQQQQQQTQQRQGQDPVTHMFQQFSSVFGTPGQQGSANFVVFPSVSAQGNPFADISTMMNQFFQADFGGLSMNNLFGLYGSPGDYAWGRNFEDLLNQFFHAGGRPGNPPAAEKAIQELTTMNVTQDQVDEKLDCSICKDEFSLDETVTQLPCRHVFHNDCVVRWLKMHNQCPVCRFELPTDDPNERKGASPNSDQSSQPQSQH